MLGGGAKCPVVRLRPLCIASDWKTLWALGIQFSFTWVTLQGCLWPSVWFRKATRFVPVGSRFTIAPSAADPFVLPWFRTVSMWFRRVAMATLRRIRALLQLELMVPSLSTPLVF